MRIQRAGRSILFLVDASGSMRAHQRMIEAKTALLTLLQDAYHKRDRVALVTFRGRRAQCVLPFTRSVERARRMLREMPTGGRTPLAEGLRTALRLLREEARRSPGLEPLLVVISDGKPTWSVRTEPLADALQAARGVRSAGIPSVFLDTDDASSLEPGCGYLVAGAMGGLHIDVGELKARKILGILGVSRSGAGPRPPACLPRRAR